MKPSKIYTFDVPAGGAFRLTVAGEYFKILATTGAVTVSSDWGTLEGLITGQGLEDTPFSHLLFTDVGGAGVTVRLFIGDEKFVDGITGAVEVSAVRETVPVRSDVFKTTNIPAIANGGGGTKVANADPNRKYLLVQNTHATVILYVSFSSVGVTSGIRIDPGTSWGLTAGVCTTQEVWLLGSATGGTARVMEG